MFGVQFITHYTDRISYLESASIALQGGCRWIQLRMKGATDDDVRPIAIECARLCREAEATFILDDRVHLAKEIRADGVHLGKEDMPIDQARAILGEEFIIGGTANTADDIRRLYTMGADYIGCGPFRHTVTKEKLSPILGEKGYRKIISMMRSEGIDIPIVGIGGVTAEDMPLLCETGLDGIALSGSILRADDPVTEMQRVMEIANRLSREQPIPRKKSAKSGKKRQLLQG